MGINISNAPSTPEWTYLEKLTFAGDTTKTSSALSVYGEYLIRYRLLQSAATGYAELRLNGDSTASYEVLAVLNNATLSLQAAQTEAILSTSSTTVPAFGWSIIDGKSPTVASGVIGGVNQTRSGGNGLNAISFQWVAGSAVQLSTITILTNTGTLTGTVEIFGRTRN